MRFRLQARPGTSSGEDSKLTLIMLCEVLGPKADERKVATRFGHQPGCILTKRTHSFITRYITTKDVIIVITISVRNMFPVSYSQHSTSCFRFEMITAKPGESFPFIAVLLLSLNAKLEQEGILNNTVP